MKIDRFASEYQFLSNFHPCQLYLWCVGSNTYSLADTKYGAKMYDSVEHFYQTNKTMDYARRDVIRGSPTASEAKKRGNSKELTVIRSDWESVKLIVMRSALEAKFAPGSELADRLLETCNAELIEGNNWGDRFWGVDYNTGGQNWLGVLLMAQRALLRSLD